MKEENFIELYHNIGTQTIDNLYMFDCLVLSGFAEKEAYKLITTLKELWLKDENNLSISKLSDMLYDTYINHYDNADELLELATRELLLQMYQDSDDVFCADF